MLKSKEGQSIALGVAMLIVWTAATVHVHTRPQGQNLASSQIGVFATMSRARNLPVEAPPQP
jgi:hypothetical protein